MKRLVFYIELAALVAANFAAPQWLERSETYAGDLELASLYFFMNKLGKFDTLWAGISTSHSLVGGDLDELDELGLVYNLLRPTIEEEENIAQLAQPILDSLAFWQNWCSEPGFLVKSVLWWNGIATVQDCNDPQKTAEREKTIDKKRKTIQPIGDIKIYPNPANQLLTLEFRQQLENANVSFFDVQGKLFKYQQLKIGDSHSSSIPIGDLSIGLYIIKVQTDRRPPYFAKLEIIR